MSGETIESAEAELRNLGFTFNPEMPYDLETMFPKRTGWGSKGEIKRKHQLVQVVEPVLSRMLKSDEHVLYVARGVQYKFSEQYFMGVWASLINQTAFVLTNLRLIMLHTDTRGRPRHTYWTIFYSQIKNFKSSWTGQVMLDLTDGTKLRFTGFRGLDRKQMPAIFEKTVADYRELGFSPEVTQSRENLCSRCLEIVPKSQYTCPSCNQLHWTPSELALRSLVFPSWGDFLMGHISFALVELGGYLFSWFILLIIVIAAAGDGGAMFAAVIMVIALAFAHISDAGLTYFVAKKGLTPKGGQ